MFTRLLDQTRPGRGRNHHPSRGGEERRAGPCCGVGAEAVRQQAAVEGIAGGGRELLQRLEPAKDGTPRGRRRAVRDDGRQPVW